MKCLLEKQMIILIENGTDDEKAKVEEYEASGEVSFTTVLLTI